jgi:hypothetical protein
MSSETQVTQTEQQTSASEVSTPAAVATNTAPTTTETTPVDWRSSLPEELKAEKSLSSITDISSLAKSYVHAQKLIGADKIPVPNKHATDEDWNAVYEKLGRPKNVADYKLNIPDAIKGDEAGIKNFSESAHKLGLLPKQAEGVLKYYADLASAAMNDANTKALTGRKNAEDSLKKEWGAAYNQKLETAGRAFKEYIGPEFQNLILSDGTKLGDNPAIAKAFAKIAETIGEDKLVSSNSPNYLTPAEIQKQINEITAPGTAFHNKNHPNHDIAVQEALQLREMLIPNKRV